MWHSHPGPTRHSLGLAMEHSYAEDLTRLTAGFRQVTANLDPQRPETSPFQKLREAWTRYYTGPFAEFDIRLQADADRGKSKVFDFISISISHHNLERLFEVLEGEIGNKALTATRVPERVCDLAEVCKRLTDLLGAATAGSSAHS